jgi:hypothetical protein
MVLFECSCALKVLQHQATKVLPQHQATYMYANKPTQSKKLDAACRRVIVNNIQGVCEPHPRSQVACTALAVCP